MKIETVHSKLKAAISTAERISKRQSSMPILACVLLETAGRNSVVIKSTNLDLGVEIAIPAKVEEEGACAVPAAVLSAFLSNVQDAGRPVKMSSDGGTLKVSAGAASGSIKAVSADDFPVIPHSASKDSFSLQGPDFVKGLKSVWYSSSVSSVKPELASVYVHCDGDMVVFAATDSFRLAEKKVKVKKTRDFGSILVPFVSVAEIMRILEGSGDVDVVLDANQISFSFEGTYLVSRIVSGTFPDYRQIIPKAYLTEAVALKEDLAGALRLSNVFSDKFNQIGFLLDPSAKRFELSTKNSDIGENTVAVDAAVTGDRLAINFNQRYVGDCFQSMDSDSVSLHFGGLNKPLLITPGSDQSFRYLVMPMNR
jgi:DNA polymerase-3 subunit beta